MTCAGLLKSFDSLGNIVEQITIPTLYGWDYMSDGYKYTTNTVTNYRFSELTSWTYNATYNAYWCYRGGINAPVDSSTPAHISSDLVPTISWNTFKLASTTDGVAYSSSDGTVWFKVSGKTDATTYAAWKAANPNSVLSYRTTGVQTTASTKTTIQIANGGSLMFIPTAGTPLVPKLLTFSGNIKVAKSSTSDLANALATATYATFDLNNSEQQPATVLNCNSDFLIKGLTGAVIGDNPYDTSKSGLSALTTTNGCLMSYDGANGTGNLVSKVCTSPIYGNATIQDEISASNGIIRRWSRELYLKDLSWTLGNDNGTQVLFYTYITPSQLPKQYLVSEVAGILSNRLVSVSESTIGSTRERVSLTYDSDNSRYKLTVCTQTSWVSDTGVPTMLKFMAQLSTYNYFIKYALATPEKEETIFDNLILVADGSVKFVAGSKTVWYSNNGTPASLVVDLATNSVCTVTAPTNTNAVITQSIKSMQSSTDSLAHKLPYINDIINVKEFGAVGDGVTDDINAIRNAISAYNQGGLLKPIVFPAGKYLVSDTIYLTSNIEMYGLGLATIVTNSTAKDLLSIRGNYVKIHDLTLNVPAGYNASAIKGDSAYATLYTNIEKVNIKGKLTGRDSTEQSFGINFIDGDTNYTYNNFITVNDCVISYVKTGIYVGIGSTPAMIQNLTLDYVTMGIWAAGFGGVYNFNGHYRTGYSNYGVYCSGVCNMFSGFMYDPQRVQYSTYYFTSTSSSNHYIQPWFFENVYINNTSYPGAGVGNYTEYEEVFDAGLNNVCMNQIKPGIVDAFCSYNYVSGADDAALQRSYPNMYGMQDNCLAYADKWATVTLDTGTIQSGTLSDLFDISGGSNGFKTGVTFNEDPSVTSIQITATFTNPIKNMHKIGIKFNDYIASSIEIQMQFTAGGVWSSYGSTTKNKLSNWYLQNNPANTNIYGIRLIIRAAFNTIVYNTSKKVGISLIWAMSGDTGGNAYLKSGGGQLYGYLGLGDVNELPAPSISYWKKQIILKGNTGVEDTLHICLKNSSDVYYWKQI